MRVGTVGSVVLHGVILVVALVSFASPRQFDVMPEAIPVDLISATDISTVTKGNEKGKKDTPPKIAAEKVDVEKPTPDPKVKVTEKQEVAPTAPAPTPPPAPQPKAEEPKPTPAPAPARPEPPPPKADEALKADPKKDEKPQQQQQAQPTPLPPKKPAPPVQQAETKPPTEQKFDADKIAQLLDKRTPQRQAASAAETSQISSLGAPRGQNATLSVTELDAFREKVKQCWKVPPVTDDKIFAYILLRLNRDGTLAQPPVITDGMMNPEQRGVFDAFAASAIRALIQCQPYTMFRPEKYDLWKEIEPKFNPGMFGSI